MIVLGVFLPSIRVNKEKESFNVKRTLILVYSNSIKESYNSITYNSIEE